MKAIPRHTRMTATVQPAIRQRRPTEARRRPIAVSARVAEAVADAADRVDRRGVPGQGELFAEIADVDVAVVRRRVLLVAPDRAEDLLARQHPSTMAQQKQDEVE